MKRKLILMLTLVVVLFATSCSTPEPKEKFELPEIGGKTLVEAIVSLGSDASANPVYIPTNEYLPGLVISYGDGLKAGDKVALGATVNVLVSQKPENAVSYDSRIEYVSEICKLTGPNSFNNEVLAEAGIQGTDLGIPVKVGDKMIFLFGDSFSVPKPTGPGWKSNFITTTTDDVYWDGLKIEPIVNDRGLVLPFFEGKHQGGKKDDTSVEVTKIPTGGITIDDTVYVFYMSIRFWGDAGEWYVNYNGVVKSNVNDLKKWEEVKELTWTEAEAPNFGQIYPFEDPNSDYIYVYGIPGGRNGGCVVGRTTKENFTNKAEYEYLVGENTWKKGDAGLKLLKADPYYVVGPAVSELSVAYNEYLGKYVMPFYRSGKIIIMTSDSPYGKFSDSISVLTQKDYNGIYGGFIHPEFITDGGKSMYMTISCWETYNVYWVKVVLK